MTFHGRLFWEICEKSEILWIFMTSWPYNIMLYSFFLNPCSIPVLGYAFPNILVSHFWKLVKNWENFMDGCFCHKQSERDYFQDYSFFILYPSIPVPHVLYSRTEWVALGGMGWVVLGWAGKAGSGEKVYAYFHDSTCSSNFHGTVFWIFGYVCLL